MRIITNALVRRVLFDGKRAVGVEFSRQSTVERIEATREVILSAGAIGSPHLLQLSGVGEPEVLQKAGIAVQHALPGVGQNFQDHYIARISCYVRDLDTLNERARGLGFANEVMRYIVQGKGMMTFGASLCAASVKVLPELATPDVQCVFAPASYKPGLIRRLDNRPGITGGPWQMRPLSRGYVLVRTPNPHDQPAINPRYLAEETDQRAMVGGLKFLRRLFAMPALAGLLRGGGGAGVAECRDYFLGEAVEVCELDVERGGANDAVEAGIALLDRLQGLDDVVRPARKPPAFTASSSAASRCRPAHRSRPGEEA